MRHQRKDKKMTIQKKKIALDFSLPTDEDKLIALLESDPDEDSHLTIHAAKLRSSYPNVSSPYDQTRENSDEEGSLHPEWQEAVEQATTALHAAATIWQNRLSDTEPTSPQKLKAAIRLLRTAAENAEIK